MLGRRNPSRCDTAACLVDTAAKLADIVPAGRSSRPLKASELGTRRGCRRPGGGGAGGRAPSVDATPHVECAATPTYGAYSRLRCGVTQPSAGPALGDSLLAGALRFH